MSSTPFNIALLSEEQRKELQVEKLAFFILWGRKTLGKKEWRDWAEKELKKSRFEKDVRARLNSILNIKK